MRDSVKPEKPVQTIGATSPFRSTKAAIKLYTLLDLRGAIPAFIHISDGKLHDVNVLDILLVEAGSFYIMDRGYLDFVRLYAMHQAGAFFVTRAKEGMNARRVYRCGLQLLTSRLGYPSWLRQSLSIPVRIPA